MNKQRIHAIKNNDFENKDHILLKNLSSKRAETKIVTLQTIGQEIKE